MDLNCWKVFVEEEGVDESFGKKRITSGKGGSGDKGTCQIPSSYLGLIPLHRAI